jgi:transposase
MERYTARQVKRALAQEQLLQRLDQGEDFETLCRELGLSLSQDYLPQLRRRYRQAGSSLRQAQDTAWEALIDHRHGHPYKAIPERRAWLREQKRENPALTQQELTDLFEYEFQESISRSRVSDVLREEGVAIPGGQRYRSQEERALPVERAGVFFPPGGRPPDGRAEHRNPGDPGGERHLSGA